MSLASYLFSGLSWYAVFCAVASHPGKRAIRARAEEITAYHVLGALPIQVRLAAAREGMVMPRRIWLIWQWRRIRSEYLEFHAHYEVTKPLHTQFMAQLDAKQRLWILPGNDP